MVFSSPVFLFAFLPAVLLLYFGLGRRLRNAVLLAASLLFYAWGEQRIVLVMLLSIGANYGFGRWMQGRPGRARLVVGLSVVFNLGLLVLFKYANWLWTGAAGLLGLLGASPGSLPEPQPIPLPIGISFFTFQALSYVVDVYRGDAKVQRRLLDFGLYIALFPQLIAGPIVRYRDVAQQLRERREGWPLFCSGVLRFVVGLGKKMLIANVVARPADEIFALPPGELPVTVAWLGVLCYTLQIYFDFSGYSDMAIGLGRMFGFRFLENFDYPYIARSITEFWRRWHISLSTWFRDYLYIPLGGNRRGGRRTLANLLIVFGLCGLWHGAAWNFIAWGLFHGTFLVLERLARDRGPRVPLALRHAYTLLVVVFGWVLFRAPGLPEALDYCAALGGLNGVADSPYGLGLFLRPSLDLALLAGALGSLPWVPRLTAWMRTCQVERPLTVRGLELTGAAGVLLILLLSAMQMSAGTYNPFIYFRF